MTDVFASRWLLRMELLITACLSQAAEVRAELPTPAGTDLFRDEIALNAVSEPEGYSQTLNFQEGRQLRGTLLALDGKEISWQRPDVNAPLRIARRNVRRIALGKDFTRENGRISLPPEIGPGTRAFDSFQATVRLSESVVLQEKVTSLDGKKFYLELGSKLAMRSEPSDLLVFKDGDELRGSLLRTATKTAIGWKMMEGQEVEFSPDRVAGVRFARKGKKPVDDAEVGEIVELRNGDRFPGLLESLDEKRATLRLSRAGQISIDRDELLSWQTVERKFTRDGADDPEGWLGDRWSESPFVSKSWIYFDGRYISRSNEPQGADPGGVSPSRIETPRSSLPERFEISFEVIVPAGQRPAFGFRIEGESGIALVDLRCAAGSATFQRTVRHRKGWDPVTCDLALPPALLERSRWDLRAFVDLTAATAVLYLDGMFIAASDVAQGAVTRASGATCIYAIEPGGSPEIVANLRIEPWNGGAPRSDLQSSVQLVNGDVSEGLIHAVRDHQVVFETGGRPVEIPTERVTALRFPGAPAMLPATVARIRLRDGGILHAASFRWEADRLSVMSALLGDLLFSSDQVSELVLNPTPMQNPTAILEGQRPPERPANPTGRR